MLRLGRLIPPDDVGVPEPPDWPPVELLELLDALDENELGIIDPTVLWELCEPLDEERDSHAGAELEAEPDPEAVDDGLNGESEDELTDPEPGAALVVPLAPFGREETVWLPDETESAIPVGGGNEAGDSVVEPEPVVGVDPAPPEPLLTPPGAEFPAG
jgi:hypothetical protein